MKKIVESYKRKLASEDGWVLQRGAQLRIALFVPEGPKEIRALMLSRYAWE